MSIDKLVHKKLTELALHQNQQTTQSVKQGRGDELGKKSTIAYDVTKLKTADNYSPHAKSGQQAGEFLYPLFNTDLITKAHNSPVCSYEVRK